MENSHIVENAINAAISKCKEKIELLKTQDKYHIIYTKTIELEILLYKQFAGKINQFVEMESEIEKVFVN